MTHKIFPRLDCRDTTWDQYVADLPKPAQHQFANLVAHGWLPARRDETGWFLTRFDAILEGFPLKHVALDGTVTNPPIFPSTVVEVLGEVKRAMVKFPTWPTDPIHASKIVDEEVGELSKAVLQQVYEPHKNREGDVRAEAIQAAAMCLRFLASLGRYDWKPAMQHKQLSLEPVPPEPVRHGSEGDRFIGRTVDSLRDGE